jgi:hypothetical protein
LTVDSYHRLSHDAEGEYDYHAVRIVYRTEIQAQPGSEAGNLVHEADGSTDMAQWFGFEELDEITLVPMGALGAGYAFGER